MCTTPKGRLPLLLPGRSELLMTFLYKLTKLCLALQNTRGLIKRCPNVFSSGFYCAVGAELHLNCDSTLCLPSPADSRAISTGIHVLGSKGRVQKHPQRRDRNPAAHPNSPHLGEAHAKVGFCHFETLVDQRIALKCLERSIDPPMVWVICLPTAALSAGGGFQSNALQCQVFRRVRATDRNIYA